MKRDFSCSDSLNHFLSHPTEGEMKSEDDCVYNGVGTGDGEDYGGEETGQFSDKKRRLSNHQVKSLEKIFEVDNKLDPDRKVKVAHELGLQPRQVAIWFQNRRARWKTKQLERDYNVLKSNYDALNHNYHKLEQEKEIIIKQLVELKAKLQEDKTERKDEFEDREKYSFFLGSDLTKTSLNYDKTEKLLELKDGFSDSDSSGVLNEENLNISNTNITSFGLSSLCSSSPTNSNHTVIKDHEAYPQSSDAYLGNNVEDESCNLFLVDQAPNLCWYFRD